MKRKTTLCSFIAVIILCVILSTWAAFAASNGALYIRVRLTADFPARLVPNTPATLRIEKQSIPVKAGQPVEIHFTSPHLTVRLDDQTWSTQWLALTPNELPPAALPTHIYGIAVNGGATYRAGMEAVVYGGLPYLINVVPMNDYLYGVIGSEMPAGWPLESLKAQAVAARTYALNKAVYREVTDATPWDICDTKDCQVYSGTKNEALSTYEAVRNTDRAVLVYVGNDGSYMGKLIDAVYHSTSPGRTLNSEDVWGSYRPYLRSRDDAAFSSKSPWYTWTRSVSITITQLSALLGMRTIITLAPVMQSDQVRGYIAIGDGVSQTFSKEQLRKWYNLPSPSFDLKMTNGKIITDPTNPGNILTVVNGRGYGHGVGMSQYGAKSMAEEGWSFSKILKYYYTDVSIERYNLTGMRIPYGYPGI
ncbi:MAG: SpoIID/LytB domain-containing protein [Limnochordia bacterium]